MFRFEYFLYYYKQTYKNYIKYASEIPSVKLYRFHSLDIVFRVFFVA